MNKAQSPRSYSILNGLNVLPHCILLLKLECGLLVLADGLTYYKSNHCNLRDNTSAIGRQ